MTNLSKRKASDPEAFKFQRTFNSRSGRADMVSVVGKYSEETDMWTLKCKTTTGYEETRIVGLGAYNDAIDMMELGVGYRPKAAA